MPNCNFFIVIKYENVKQKKKDYNRYLYIYPEDSEYLVLQEAVQKNMLWNKYIGCLTICNQFWSLINFKDYSLTEIHINKHLISVLHKCKKN